MIISDTYVSEIQLVTNGFAAEFGNTPGLIMNVVTPSGTNALHGSVSYRFRRPSFYSRPFFYPSPDDLPENKTDNFTAAAGDRSSKTVGIFTAVMNMSGATTRRLRDSS